MYTSFLFLNFFNLKNFYLFFFYYDYYYFLAVPCSMQDLISLTRDGTHPPMLEVQSLNQWTSREVPVVNLLKASHFHLMASVRVTLNQQLIFLVGKPFMAVLAKQAHSSAHREVLGAIFFTKSRNTVYSCPHSLPQHSEHWQLLPALYHQTSPCPQKSLGDTETPGPKYFHQPLLCLWGAV